MSTDAQHSLKIGDEYPYDAPDQWSIDYPASPPPPPIDYAHRAARGIVADLTDRRAIKLGFNEIDEDVRAEIVASLAEIIREAVRQDSAQ